MKHENAKKARLRGKIADAEDFFRIIEHYSGETPDGRHFIAGVVGIVRNFFSNRTTIVDAISAMQDAGVLVEEGTMKEVNDEVRRAALKNNPTLDKKRAVLRSSYLFSLSSTKVHRLDVVKFASFCRKYVRWLREQMK